MRTLNAKILCLSLIVLFQTQFQAAYAEGKIVRLSREIEKDGVRLSLEGTGVEYETHNTTATLKDGDQKISVKIESFVDFPTVDFVEMDSSNNRPEIIISAWTGGAHCCSSLTILTQYSGQWKSIAGGEFDGDPYGLKPEDLDGDGMAEISTHDDRFLYRWTSYAESSAPPAIFGIRDGDLVRITGEPQFHPFLRQWLNDNGQAPKTREGGINSWLATHAAVKLMLGDKDAFKLADSQYDREDDWGLTGCSIEPAQDELCPEDKVTTISFPDDLRNFLRENNFLDQQ